jgi:predicted MPP superfamily phosphohydrolase
MNKSAYEKRFSERAIFWVIYTAVLLGMHVYFYFRILEASGGKSLSLLWLVWSVFIVALQIIVRKTMTAGLNAERRMTDRLSGGWAVMIAIAFFIMLILRGFYRLTGIGMSPLSNILFSFTAGALVLLFGVKQVNTVQTVFMKVPTKKLPEGRNRLRIVQLTDLHLGPFTGISLLAQILRLVRETAPDIVVVTGDLADGELSERRRELAMLRRIKPPYGVYAVPGNHDYYDDIDEAVRFMEAAGMTVLRGESARTAGIIIAGADDLDHTLKADWNLTRSESLVLSHEKEQKETFLLLLRHRPVVEQGTLGHFDLQLSGHTHGGQLIPSPTSRHRIAGRPRGLKKLKGGGYLYVSNGAGFVGPPVRLMAPPEIAVFDLVPDDGSAED